MKNNEIILRKDNQVFLCNDNFYSCFCKKEKRHQGFHQCRCGGSWDNEYNSKSLPNIGLGFGAFPNTKLEEKILEELKIK